ncbi:MAG: nucleotidyltransferase domain-containing protein [Thermoanaerobacterales bacterium]|nr:nucleotidyltransferase domain-containing protein [Thermoanaerobacterales bacterium]
MRLSEDEIMRLVGEYLARQDDVTAAYVYGSVASGRMRAGSDVDVAVLFSADQRDGAARLERCLELEIALQDLVRRPVQVVDITSASLFLQHQVRKTGQRVVDKDPSRRAAQEAASRERYLDMLPLYNHRINLTLRRL